MVRSLYSTELFSGPFSLAYWKTAWGETRNLRMVVIAALLIGIKIVISTFFVPVGENLRIYFSFFVSALGGMIYGPAMALGVGFVGDIIGFCIHPSGAYFPGYTLSEMIGTCLYGLFFYRSKISMVKIALCKFCVNLLVNVGLGTLWSSILMAKGFYYFLVKSAVKNAIMLPIEIFLIILFFRMMLPVLVRYKIIPPSQYQGKIPIV